MTNATGLRVLEEEIIRCRRCPRLVEYREKVAKEKRRAFREWTYWGRPVPGFGDLRAELFILGLAPGAHGSNRTGRMFTGDRSGISVRGVAQGGIRQPSDLAAPRRRAGIEECIHCGGGAMRASGK